MSYNLISFFISSKSLSFFMIVIILFFSKLFFTAFFMALILASLSHLFLPDSVLFSDNRSYIRLNSSISKKNNLSIIALSTSGLMEWYKTKRSFLILSASYMEMLSISPILCFLISV